MKWHIGCSGFYYKHWKGEFYPADLPQKSWFEHYCKHFNTLELNGTFYSFPKPLSLKRWYDESPADFSFAVKAHRGITHYKRFNDIHERVSDFYELIKNGLSDKLGAVLFQLPPSFAYSDERLKSIVTSLNPSFNNVVELRHNSWWIPEVYDEFTKGNISFCGMSHPDLPDDVIATTSDLYYRLHGNRQLYTSQYTHDELMQLVKHVEATGANQCYIYFNNDIGAAAVKNALELIKLTGAR
ncbi:DUF72 domain-containing protein [Mucilaginibacter aquatilis]|uniref:DUF72 domain-containing protein n=1 Tax=Mucilaginibacter aquatilis TaxID=1517760 RepID=A0A6I4I371_9SPHI|nr:DUF72 domain-containing protein [Mucilaginibacter aquatilis]MVN89585.1 DUF72 domain-containing protein [Mucilaginibacter aquatilis]